MELLADFSLEELTDLTESMGLPRFRARQLYDGINSACDFSEMTGLPKALLSELGQRFFAVGVSIYKIFRSKDGSKKYLLKLNDGNLIECVYMPHNYGDTICVSTQVGCRMGCIFCASGKGGLVRNLTSGEMLGQVVLINKAEGGTLKNRKITNIVLMGSGEPLDNYTNVTKFLRLVNAGTGINISQRNISLSTCGLVEGIRRLADDGFTVTLSISLHATTDEIRQELLPISNKYSIAEVFAAARYYFEKNGRRIIFEYSMVDGKNISIFDAKRLKELTKGLPSHINLIMLNNIGADTALPAANKVKAERFKERLTELGVSATIRKSFGSDIEGACGQLRNQFVGQKDDKK